MGVVCPGYLPAVVFVATAVPQRKPMNTKNNSQIESDSTHPEDVLISHQISTGSEQDAGLLQGFISDTPPRLWYTKTWFAGICRSPSDPTLEAAVRALVTAHGALKLHNDSLYERSRRAYGDSLRSLRKVVVHTPRNKLNEIQNSILTLAICELYQKCLEQHATEAGLKSLIGSTHVASPGLTGTWAHHAAGIEQLMKRQGPSAYTKYDNNLLFYVAMRDTLILLAYTNHTTCFLDEPSWRSIIFGHISKGDAISYSFSAFHAIHLQGPRLVVETDKTILRGEDRTDLLQHATQLRRDAKATLDYFMKELEKISKRPEEVASVPTTSTERPPESFYSFRGVRFFDVLTPRAICMHHSLIIVVNREHQRLLEPQASSDASLIMEMEEESRLSALEICKCFPALEKMPVTMLGVFALAFLNFFLDRAWEACDESLRPWVEERQRQWANV